MSRLEHEASAIRALSRASDALTEAAFDLMLLSDIAGARNANDAAREANERVLELSDAVLSRWWVKPLLGFGRLMGWGAGCAQKRSGD